MNTDKYDTDEIVGYEVKIRVRRTAMLTETVQKHWIGSEAACRRKASLVSNFHSVESLAPITGREWARGYGDPRIRSKFS